MWYDNYPIVVCKDCIHCNSESLICRPESKDAEEEYALDPEDLYTPGHCDFFKKKEEK